MLVERFFGRCDVRYDTVFLRWDKTRTAALGEPAAPPAAEDDQTLAQLVEAATEQAQTQRRLVARMSARRSASPTARSRRRRTSTCPIPRAPTRWAIPGPTSTKGSRSSSPRAVHAEARLIAAAARTGVSTDGAAMYVTDFPCPPCAKLIAGAGIGRLYFREAMRCWTVRMSWRPPASRSFGSAETVPGPLEEEMSELRERPGSTQELVRAMMLRAGGYWRPLAAVARLLEELGELVELLGDPAPASGELAHELADLWIITTALADQFLGVVAEPRTKTGEGLESAGAVMGTIVAAGEIARVVNYYDGPKTPRSLADMPSLRGAVPRFHEALGALARSLGIDLAKAVAEKIEVIHGRDMERFEREDSDPSTAASLGLLRNSPALAGDPVLELRLWGAPSWTSGSVSEAAATMAPSLVSFAKAAGPEELQGYVIAGPATKGMDKPYWLDALLAALVPGAADSEQEGESRLRLGGVVLGVRILPSRPEDPWTFVLLGLDG